MDAAETPAESRFVGLNAVTAADGLKVGLVPMKRSAFFAGLLLLSFPCNSLLNPVAWGQAAAQGTQQSPSTPAPSSSMNRSRVRIPGPLRAFLRMAAISQKSTPEEVLPFLARNVVVEGYQYWQDKARKPTEFLKLLKDY